MTAPNAEQSTFGGSVTGEAYAWMRLGDLAAPRIRCVTPAVSPAPQPLPIASYRVAPVGLMFARPIDTRLRSVAVPTEYTPFTASENIDAGL